MASGSPNRISSLPVLSMSATEKLPAKSATAAWSSEHRVSENSPAAASSAREAARGPSTTAAYRGALLTK